VFYDYLWVARIIAIGVFPRTNFLDIPEEKDTFSLSFSNLQKKREGNTTLICEIRAFYPIWLIITGFMIQSCLESARELTFLNSSQNMEYSLGRLYVNGVKLYLLINMNNCYHHDHSYLVRNMSPFQIKIHYCFASSSLFSFSNAFLCLLMFLIIRSFLVS